MELLRKITIGGINNIKKGFKDITEKMLVARVIGVANAFEVITHAQYGDSYKFTGEFRAINGDGEESAAPVIYLVKPVDEMLVAQLKAAEGKPVQFAFDIHVVPDEGSERGYQYRVTPLMESKPSNPLAELMASLPAPVIKPKQLALAGDAAATTEKAPDAATETPAETPASEKAPAAGKKPKQ